jgi:hypothetical protein
VFNSEASSSISIALFGGIVAWRRFRTVPQQHQKTVLEDMREHYERTKDLRTEAFNSGPPILLVAKREIESKMRGLRMQSQTVSHTQRLDVICTGFAKWIGVEATAAHEILADEAKFRTVLHCVYSKNLGAKYNSDCSVQIVHLNQIADGLINSLTDFTMFIENKAYPQFTALSLLHRSIAPICKILEPVVWARSIDGRSGRRVVRLGLLAEVYNDSCPLHWENGLGLSAGGTQVVVRQSRMQSSAPSAFRAFCARVFWRAREKEWLPGLFWSARLRIHRKCEENLAKALKSAYQQDLRPTDLSWGVTKKGLIVRYL